MPWCAHSRKPTVFLMTIKIGGKSRPFKLTLGTFAGAEREHGFRVTIQDLSDPSIGFLVTTLFVGLNACDRTLTMGKVADMLDATDRPMDILEQVSTALADAFGVDEPGAGDDAGSGDEGGEPGKPSSTGKK